MPKIFHLHTDIKITKTHIQQCKNHALRGTTIFNPDRHRFQHIVKSSTLKKRIVAYLKNNGWLEDRAVGTTAVLHSIANCKQQPWHTDFDPDVCKSAKVKPLGVLFALQNSTFFNVYKKKRIEMKQGDIILFEGDVIHAGAKYDTENTRIHMYLDSSEVKRLTDKTYLIQWTFCTLKFTKSKYNYFML